MEWKISVPIFRNNVIMKQLGIAVGIPFGLLAVILILMSGKSIYTLYALGMIVTMLFLTWLLIMLLYRGKYEVEFLLNKKGIRCRTQKKQTHKNSIQNALTVIFGFLSGRPAVVGAGLLAQSRQTVFLSWNRVTKIKFKPKQHVILLRGGWTTQVGLFCNEDNYDEVLLYVFRYINND